MNKDLFGKPINSNPIITNTKIELIRLHRLDSGGSIKALADIQINEEFVIKGFKIVEGREGLFVGMPAEVGRNGRWIDTFVPLTDEIKAKIEKIIIQAYEV